MPSKAAVEMAKSARNLARNECRTIVRALGPKRRVHDSIHEARKAVRRLRALLALVTERVPDAVPIDRVLERFGDGLSALRDAHVAVETAKGFSLGHRKRWTTAIARLTERRDALLARTLTRDPCFERRRALLRRVADRIDKLDWERLRIGDLRRALHHSKRRVARAKQRSDSQPSAESGHRWRRRVRKLRFQMEAIGELAAALAKRESQGHVARKVKLLHRLSDELGARRDAQMLQQVLKRLPGVPNRRDLLWQVQIANPQDSGLAPPDFPEPARIPSEAEADIVG
jgi:CHAD domain-containing protein